MLAGQNPKPRIKAETVNVAIGRHTPAVDVMVPARLIAALPEVADQAMRAATPDHYTPYVAAEFSVVMAGEVARAHRVHKARRTLTPEQTTPAFEEGLGGRLTNPVETEARCVDDESPRGSEELPLFSVRAAVLDERAQAYGRRTEVWLNYGPMIATLLPARAREALAALREFADRFEAVIEVAE